MKLHKNRDVKFPIAISHRDVDKGVWGREVQPPHPSGSSFCIEILEKGDKMAYPPQPLEGVVSTCLQAYCRANYLKVLNFQMHT